MPPTSPPADQQPPDHQTSRPPLGKDAVSPDRPVPPLARRLAGRLVGWSACERGASWSPWIRRRLRGCAAAGAAQGCGCAAAGAAQGSGCRRCGAAVGRGLDWPGLNQLSAVNWARACVRKGRVCAHRERVCMRGACVRWARASTCCGRCGRRARTWAQAFYLLPCTFLPVSALCLFALRVRALCLVRACTAPGPPQDQ
jgi:hypothetical protein